MSIATQDCDRCHRRMPNQLSVEFVGWKALDEAGYPLICPGCVTLDEATAVSGDGDTTGGALARSDGAAVTAKGAADPYRRLAMLVSGMLTALVSDMVVELEELGGISGSRIEEIAGGEEPTIGELEELGYAFVQLLRVMKDQ